MRYFPKDLDIEEAKSVAIDFYDLNLEDGEDIVALAYQQIFDFIVAELDEVDQDYILNNYYVYANYLDSSITYHELDTDRLEKIHGNMETGQARDLFEQYFLCF